MQDPSSALDAVTRAVSIWILQILWFWQRMFDQVFRNERYSNNTEAKKPTDKSDKINLMDILRHRSAILYPPPNCINKNCVMSPTEEAMIRCACAKGQTKRKYYRC